MLFSELKNTLQNLKNRKITNEYFANLYGTSPQNISKRVKNESEVTVKELEIAQKDSGVLIYIKANDPNYKIINNSLERKNDLEIHNKLSKIGQRLNTIQEKHEYLDKDMAKLLKISEADYSEIKSGIKEFDINTLTRFKQLFFVSIDWLLFDE